MIGRRLWLVIALSLAHSSSLLSGQDGPDSGADTSNSPSTVEGGKAKGLRLPSTTPAGNQLLLEWYANMHVSPSLHMGPVIQAVWDPAAGVSTSIVYGWRASWAY